MTKTIFDTNSIGAGMRWTSDEDNSDYLVRKDVMFISTNSSHAFHLLGEDHDLEIRGFVSGGVGAFIGDSAADTGNSLVVTGTGHLIGSNLGAQVFGAAHLENEGTIRAGLTGAYLNLSSGTTTVVNAGLILGGNYGVLGVGSEGTTIQITNEGRIVGNACSYAGGLSVDVVINRGVMTGSVDLSGANDMFDNRGGRVEGTVEGSAGNDRFLPGASAEILYGGADRDTLDFRSGAGLRVSLSDTDGTGRAEGDSYNGFERVWGSSVGSDTLVGDGSANTLVGLGGADRLLGRQGGDRLNGGADKDRLVGGFGSDVFEFTRPSHGSDVIIDFSAVGGNADRIRVDASNFGGGLVSGAELTDLQFDAQDSNLAQTASVRFIWETDAEKLWFDANGAAAGGLTLLADMQDGAQVTSEIILLA